MNYKIYCDFQLIAEFRNEYDRDVALLALQEDFEDCKFTTK